MKNHHKSVNEMSSGGKLFFSRIFPLIFIVIGGSVGAFGTRNLIRAKASTEWPSVQGEIIKSFVDRKESHDSDGRHSTTYHAEIQYNYSVDNSDFTGDRVAYGDYGSSDPSHAREVVSRYPTGRKVAVYYMPGKPAESLLETGIKGQSFFLPIFGLVFFSVGLFMAVKLPGTLKK